MLEDLKQSVWQANLDLHRSGLVVLTWGNVSGIDRDRGLVVIKPSGVSYQNLKPEDLPVVALDGTVIEGKMKPSSDTPTHLILYRNFQKIGGITHTHSVYAVMFAQACKEIPCLGTTHADQFSGAVPVARDLTEDEISEDYESNTGRVIVERFARMDPVAMPAVLSARHGPFMWGKDAGASVTNAVALETVARMAFGTILLNSDISTIPSRLLDKHYQRKHGPNAYYGQ